MTGGGSKGGGAAPFVRRWSQRKRHQRAAGEPRPEPGAVGRADAAAEPELEGLPDDEVLRRLGLPDPDTLKAGADFAAFMARAVPERIRNRALRRLWVSDPVLANLDGLIDYAEDYSDAAKAVPGLRTAYRVGKGYADRLAELARSEAGPGAADRAGPAGGEAPGAAGTAPETPGTTEPSPGPPRTGGGTDDLPAPEAQPPAATQTGAQAEGAGPAAAPGARPKRRRHMVFRVVEG